jgi:hypothetical protein
MHWLRGRTVPARRANQTPEQALGELMNPTRRIALLASSSLILMAAFASVALPSIRPFFLHWTAPGDDSLVGRASVYGLRYSKLMLTPANFRQATPIGGLPSPAIAGTPESLLVSGLPDSVPLYVAIESADDAGNWSQMSNVLTLQARTASVMLSTVSFSLPRPNPARSSAHWSYAVAQSAQVQVDVFDVAGRHVQNVASGERGAGAGELSWDLRDEQGRPVGAGLYFVTAHLGPRMWTERLIVVR